jgi:glycine C-acetyltransferase
MIGRLNVRLAEALAVGRRNGTYKVVKELQGTVGAHVELADRGRVLLFSSNDYLGLSSRPEVVVAAKAALDRFGASTASVRFICGTLSIHRELETELSRFLGVGSALTYSSCWAANTGLIPAITQAGDVVLADELNHASLIDGGRLAPKGVERRVYGHADMADLARLLSAAASAPARFIVTDGVFSMEGDLAPLPDIAALARAHDAVVVLDDSHGMGVMGETGRGTAEHFGVAAEIDIYTGTLGKALGGGTGGFVAGPLPVIETLVQRSRPHLFSNALPASVAGASLAGLRILEEGRHLPAALRAKAAWFRQALREHGIQAIDSPSAIVPVIVGETARAIAMAERLLDHGLFVTGFGFPVVPEGTARLRFQVSAGHSEEDLREAVAIIAKAWSQARHADAPRAS